MYRTYESDLHEVELKNRYDNRIGYEDKNGPKKAKKKLAHRESIEIHKKNSASKNRDANERISRLIAKYGYTTEYDDKADSYEDEVKEDDTPKKTLSRERPSVRGVLKASHSKKRFDVTKEKKKVSFNKIATLHHFPAHECDEARESRRGNWSSAPDHDELWDGYLQEFRKTPLSQGQLETLQKRYSYYDESMYYGEEANREDSYDSYGTDEYDELDDYLDGLDSSSTDSSTPESKDACYICLPIKKWKCRDVTDWVKDNVAGGEFFSANFDLHNVDGIALVLMEERELKSIGIKRRADRQAILNAKTDLLRGRLATRTCNCSSCK